MMTRYKILLLLMAVLITESFYGQSGQKEERAKILVDKYIDFATFKDGFDSASMERFAELFDDTASIVFDIPFRNSAVISDDIKRISKDDRQQQPVINTYGKLVSVDMYLEVLKREAEKFELNAFDFSVIRTGRVDLSRIDSDIIIYEVKKQFIDTTWSLQDTVKYLVCIGFLNKEPRILSVHPNDENTAMANVQIKLVDVSNEKNDMSGFAVSLQITFKERINDTIYTRTTDSDGVARFGRVANTNSLISLESVVNSKEPCYFIPPDWDKGKPVSEQPADGFVIRLEPYKINLFDYSLFLSAGGFVPGEVEKVNFQSGSDFESKMGYKFGLGFNFTYFLLANQCHYDFGKGIFGLGSGISADYQKSVVNSNSFEQQKYDFLDQDGDACQVSFAGKDFSEENDMLSIAIPVFLEFRKQASKSILFSARAGVSFSLPITSNYEASGTFSRWGYYDEFNSLPITDDRVFNYFTDDTLNYSGDIEYGTILGEGFIKLNGLFKLGKDKLNYLNLGLVFSLPFTPSTVYTYPEGQPQDYQGYWINTGNDEYHSAAYATEKIYRYYFGLSVGYSLMRGRIKRIVSEQDGTAVIY